MTVLLLPLLAEPLVPPPLLPMALPLLPLHLPVLLPTLALPGLDVSFLHFLRPTLPLLPLLLLPMALVLSFRPALLRPLMALPSSLLHLFLVLLRPQTHLLSRLSLAKRPQLLRLSELRLWCSNKMPGHYWHPSLLPGNPLLHQPRLSRLSQPQAPFLLRRHRSPLPLPPSHCPFKNTCARALASIRQQSPAPKRFASSLSKATNTHISPCRPSQKPIVGRSPVCWIAWLLFRSPSPSSPKSRALSRRIMWRRLCTLQSTRR